MAEANQFDEIPSTPHAMVFLTVQWSSYERVARADFRNAVARLRALGIVLRSFEVNEDLDDTQSWLSSLALPSPLGQGIPIGAGSVLWLEAGRVVDVVVSGMQEREVGLIQRTRMRWEH